MIRRAWRFLVSCISYAVWHNAAIPADDDTMADRFRRNEGMGW